MASHQEDLTEDMFIERFRSIVNHLDHSTGFDFGYGCCLFNTYGEEFKFVCDQYAARIWTLIEGDNGLYIESGLHFVNRLGYFVSATEAPAGQMISVRLDRD